jgi:hypothetical protein
VELDTVAKLVQAFYRLVGMAASDPSLVKHGEDDDDVAYYYLTRGFRGAQRWLIDNGFQSYWRKRTSALTWSGSDTTGGRYSALPSDFLRLWGDRTRVKSALVEADGTDYGDLIDEEQSAYYGDFYYLKGAYLWITRGASPPDPIYLEYHHKHPAISSTLADNAIDFEMDARPLAVAEAADAAASDSWLPGGTDMESKIARALEKARGEARRIARRTRSARRFAEAPRWGNHW